MASPDIIIDDLAGDGPYTAVVAACPQALLYHGVAYGRFLKAMMPHARCEYLVAVVDGAPVAALPTFALESDAHGTVVNSLPFYGSHGGVLIVPGAPDGVAEALIDAFHARNRANGVVAATVVENPLAEAGPLPGRAPDLTDQRIGQFSPLPDGIDRGVIADALFAQYHQKTRNMVRKGQRANYGFREEISPAMFDHLARMHVDGMRAIGGKHKQPIFFAAVQDMFAPGSEYRLFIAETAEGEIAAMLLMLYHRRFAEYFVPVSDAAHRSNQPLSALIHHAMVKSVIGNGSDTWNWGGTWLTQDGVYRFKSRWGTEDRPYDYRIWLYPENGDVTRLTPGELGSAFPDFFVVPYSALAGAGTVDA